MLLLLLLLHPGELGHVDEATVEDDFGLGVVGRALELESLNLSIVSQGVEQILCIVVNVAKDHPLIPLTVSQGQLLQGDLVLLRLADRDRNAVLIGRLVDGHGQDGLSWGRLHRLTASWLAHRLEGDVLDAHGHGNRVQDLLERLGLEWLGRLAEGQLAVVDGLGVVDHARLFRDHGRELNEVFLNVRRVGHIHLARSGERGWLL